MNKTVELVKTLARQPQYATPSPHHRRLEAILGRKVILRSAEDAYSYTLEQLEQHNLRLIVNYHFALRFRYHATIITSNGSRSKANYSGAGKADTDGDILDKYNYAGDIPDSVLNNIEVFKDVAHGNYPAITVHSVAPLPYRVERIPKLVEPVAIGWLGKKVVFDNTWFGWRFWGDEDAVGVILGIWDGEKEMAVI